MVRRVMRTGALIGWWAIACATPTLAQDNLSKGKTVQQLFASDCAICHNDGKKLGASKSQGQLAAFLAEHYTTSKTQAAALAGYLGAIGAPERQRRPRRTGTKSSAGKSGKPPAN
jgi:mono/diheme cytochrome c family protein